MTETDTLTGADDYRVFKRIKVKSASRKDDEILGGSSRCSPKMAVKSQRVFNTDILANIFSFVLEKKVNTAMNLALVCSAWRDAVKHTIMYGQVISVQDCRVDEYGEIPLSIWLRLTITLRFGCLRMIKKELHKRHLAHVIKSIPWNSVQEVQLIARSQDLQYSYAGTGIAFEKLLLCRHVKRVSILSLPLRAISTALISVWMQSNLDAIDLSDIAFEDLASGGIGTTDKREQVLRISKPILNLLQCVRRVKYELIPENRVIDLLVSCRTAVRSLDITIQLQQGNLLDERSASTSRELIHHHMPLLLSQFEEFSLSIRRDDDDDEVEFPRQPCKNLLSAPLKKLSLGFGAFSWLHNSLRYLITESLEEFHIDLTGSVHDLYEIISRIHTCTRLRKVTIELDEFYYHRFYDSYGGYHDLVEEAKGSLRRAYRRICSLLDAFADDVTIPLTHVTILGAFDLEAYPLKSLVRTRLQPDPYAAQSSSLKRQRIEHLSFKGHELSERDRAWLRANVAECDI